MEFEKASMDWLELSDTGIWNLKPSFVFIIFKLTAAPTISAVKFIRYFGIVFPPWSSIARPSSVPHKRYLNANNLCVPPSACRVLLSVSLRNESKSIVSQDYQFSKWAFCGKLKSFASYRLHFNHPQDDIGLNHKRHNGALKNLPGERSRDGKMLP